MKSLEIVGDSYVGSYDRVRRACRGIIVQDGKILLSHGAAKGLWMIPGGGLEEGEDERECCIREVAEETGYRIEPEACVLETVEYFRSLKHINHYFTAKVVGQAAQHLTEVEQKMDMAPCWVPIPDAIETFSHFGPELEMSDLRRSLYQREYAVLRELFEEMEN